MIYALLIIETLIVLFALYGVWRLNKYIQTLEDNIEEQIERIDKVEELVAPLIQNSIKSRNLISED